MATTDQPRMTLKEFLELPDEEPALELDPDGTVVQKVSPKGKHSRLQFRFASVIDSFAEPRRLAVAFPELRAVFGGAAYVLDVAVYRWERVQRDDVGEVANDFTEPPDISIEIVSPKQSVDFLVRRSVWYVNNGVQIALVVDPDDRSVLVFRRDTSPAACLGADPIDLTEVLPGFELTAQQVFDSLKI